VTVVPDAPFGTPNAQPKAPVPSVVREPLVQLAIVTPSKTSPTGLVTEKPVPVTVMMTSIGPWAGLTVMAGIVTENVPVAVWPLASVAVTVVPNVPLGTTNVQLKAPVPPVVNEPPPGQLEIARESNTSDVSDVETEKPVPATVTVAPTGPTPGVTVIPGAVTVKFAVAESNAPSLPVATTLYGTLLAESDGTVNVQEKAPVPDVTWPVHVWTGVAPLKVSVTMSVLGVKPESSNVTVMPVGPCEGTRVIVGVVIVKDAVRLSALPSDPVAVTVYGVADDVPETVTVQPNVPVPDTVAPQAPIVAPAPIVVVTVTPGVKPVPDTPTDTPLGPRVSVRVIPSVVILNDAAAWSKLPSDPAAVTV
jgi:hypothetical protein